MPDAVSYNTVLNFWFKELDPKDWYRKDPQLDAQMKATFGTLHQQCARGELASWRHWPEGRLAEIILLDQLSRNIYRDLPAAFATDTIALTIAQFAIMLGDLDAFAGDSNRQNLLVMPHMHSESLVVHEQAVALRKAYGLGLDYEMRHKEIIERFGRYPHRNEILGRVSTPEEQEFLQQPGSSF